MLIILKYMVMSRDQNAGRSDSIKIYSKSLERVEEVIYLETTLKNQNSIEERVEEVIYLETTLKNQNSIEEEIKSRLKSGNAC